MTPGQTRVLVAAWPGVDDDALEAQLATVNVRGRHLYLSILHAMYRSSGDAWVSDEPHSPCAAVIAPFVTGVGRRARRAARPGPGERTVAETGRRGGRHAGGRCYPTKLYVCCDGGREHAPAFASFLE